MRVCHQGLKASFLSILLIFNNLVFCSILGFTKYLGMVKTTKYWWGLGIFNCSQSRKCMRVSFNKTPEFLFWGRYICVDFILWIQKTKQKNKNKPHKIIRPNTNIGIYEPHSWNRISILGFITILCLKFRSLMDICSRHNEQDLL